MPTQTCCDPRYALLRALSERNINGRDRARIRMALWTQPRARQRILDMLESEMLAAGFIDEIDWEKLLDFIIELIPVILQIIMLFLGEDTNA